METNKRLKRQWCERRWKDWFLWYNSSKAAYAGKLTLTNTTQTGRAQITEGKDDSLLCWTVAAVFHLHNLCRTAQNCSFQRSQTCSKGDTCQSTSKAYKNFNHTLHSHRVHSLTHRYLKPLQRIWSVLAGPAELSWASGQSTRTADHRCV